MSGNNGNNRLRAREPLTDTQLLMYISIGIFVVMYAAAALTLKGGFLKPQMIFDLLNDNAALIIISCALTIVMIGGGINISVGGVIGLTVMSCALFLNNNHIESSALSILVTLLLALGIGLGFGVLQGFLVAHLEIQPFIVTLAGMFLARGLTTILSVNPVKVAHKGFLELVKTKLKISWLGYTAQNGNLIPAKIEIGALVAVAVVILMFLLLRYTRLGRSIYAVGGNRQSALMLGINVRRTRFCSHLVSSLLAGIAYLLTVKSGWNMALQGGELEVISSVVIGGTLLTGGVGYMIGTMFGVLLKSVIPTLITFNGTMSSWWGKIATGALLLLFIVIQRAVVSYTSKRKKN